MNTINTEVGTIMVQNRTEADYELGKRLGLDFLGSLKGLGLDNQLTIAFTKRGGSIDFNLAIREPGGLNEERAEPIQFRIDRFRTRNDKSLGIALRRIVTDKLYEKRCLAMDSNVDQDPPENLGTITSAEQKTLFYLTRS